MRYKIVLASTDIKLVFIRPHPATVVTPDLSDIMVEGSPVEVSNLRTLSEDIARTDLAIVGSSTLAVELLRGGRPVFYANRLDGLIHDHNGNLKQGLVPACPETFDETVFGDLAEHYLSKDWVEKMRYFDCGYQRDEAAMLEEFRVRVTDVVLGYCRTVLCYRHNFDRNGRRRCQADYYFSATTETGHASMM